MQIDRYSRLVACLKVLFPLMALAVLSTLFMLSRTPEQDAVIPFADTEIQERLRDQQITGPFYSAATSSGDMISFSAKKLTTPLGNPGANTAEEVVAQLDLTGGSSVTLVANTATYDLAKDMVELLGDVVITTSTGYDIRSDKLVSEMSTLSVRSPNTVTATGPLGDLTAGGMVLKSPESASNAQLVFNKGVNLIYKPKQLKE